MTESRAVTNAENRVKSVFGADSRVFRLFHTCLYSTLEKTVFPEDDGTCFVITGDIPAMWLRDSSCQFRPYILLAKEDQDIRRIILGILRRQFRLLTADPYANAFNREPTGAHYAPDKTQMLPEVWERKFELDSLCYPFQLSYLLWKNTGEVSQFDDKWLEAARTAVSIMKREQNHQSDSSYRFIRTGMKFTETLSRDGKGTLTKDGIGLVWSGFRPSDDACVYGYNIPQNMLASVVLSEIHEIAGELLHLDDLAEQTRELSAEIRNAVFEYGVLPGLADPMFAYEVDGYGQYLIMDDANVPSLLAAPYIGFCEKTNSLYQNTRKSVLSEQNPYYFTGRILKGVGSPHTKTGRVWPIALAVQGLTAETSQEKREVLDMLVQSDNHEGLIHEAVDPDDVSQYSRPWFSWADSMYCELVMEFCGMRLNL